MFYFHFLITYFVQSRFVLLHINRAAVKFLSTFVLLLTDSQLCVLLKDLVFILKHLGPEDAGERQEKS